MNKRQRDHELSEREIAAAVEAGLAKAMQDFGPRLDELIVKIKIASFNAGWEAALAARAE